MTTKRGGGGRKSPILRRHSLWMAPWHPRILRPRALFYRKDCTRRSKVLTHVLGNFDWHLPLFPTCWCLLWMTSIKFFGCQGRNITHILILWCSKLEAYIYRGLLIFIEAWFMTPLVCTNGIWVFSFLIWNYNVDWLIRVIRAKKEDNQNWKSEKKLKNLPVISLLFLKMFWFCTPKSETLNNKWH